MMNAIEWDGRQHVPYGLSPSLQHKTGIQEMRQREAPNIPACSTCFAPPCREPTPEEEVGLLFLSLPEWDDLSMSHLRHDMDPVSLETALN